MADGSPSRYGSDDSGLIWGFLFGRQPTGLGITSSQAVEWFRTRDHAPEKEFVWLHFSLSNTATERWLTEHSDIVPGYQQALHEGLRSTRIEIAEDSLIAVVNDVTYDFSFEPSDISTLWISVTKNTVISARRSPLKSMERLRKAVAQGETLRSAAEVLIHLLRDQADVLMNIVREAMSRIDAIEDTLLAGRLNHRRADLGAIRRVLVRLQRLLAPEPAALFRLLQRPPAWMDELDAQELRQSTEEFSVVLSELASLQERIKLLQEEVAATVNDENNRSLYVLTMVTVLALPINIMAGLFGMNVGGVPWSGNEYGFWIVASVVFSFTVIAGWLVLKRQRNF